MIKNILNLKNTKYDDFLLNIFFVVLSNYNFIEILEDIKTAITQQNIKEKNIKEIKEKFDEEDINKFYKILIEIKEKKDDINAFNQNFLNIVNEYKKLNKFYHNNVFKKNLNEMKLSEFYKNLSENIKELKNQLIKLIEKIQKNKNTKKNNDALNSIGEYKKIINNHFEKINKKNDDLKNFYENKIKNKIKEISNIVIKEELNKLIQAANYIKFDNKIYNDSKTHLKNANKKFNEDVLPKLKEFEKEKQEIIKKINEILEKLTDFNTDFFYNKGKPIILKSIESFSDFNLENNQCVFMNELIKLSYFKKFQSVDENFLSDDVKEFLKKIKKLKPADYSKYEKFIKEINEKEGKITDEIRIDSANDDIKKIIGEIIDFFNTLKKLFKEMEKNVINIK